MFYGEPGVGKTVLLLHDFVSAMRPVLFIDMASALAAFSARWPI